MSTVHFSTLRINSPHNEWVWHALCEMLRHFLFICEVRSWLWVYIPFPLSGHLSQAPRPSQVIPVNRVTSITAPSSPHPHLSPPPPPPPRCFSGLPCFNIISFSQDLWNATFPPFFWVKTDAHYQSRCGEQIGTLLSLPDIMRSDLLLSTN